MYELIQLFENVFSLNEKIFTKNLLPGKKVYGESLINVKGIEYREWVPWRSKLGAGIKKGLKELPIKKGSKVLYLGSAEGTSVSHVSDIIEEKGLVIGIDISGKAMQKFISLAEKRPNIIPLMADANQPKEYKQLIDELKPGVLFQDVSQPNQTQIFIKNSEMFLKKGDYALLALKARSIDVTKQPKDIFEKELKEIEKYFEVKQVLLLAPFEKDHALFLCRKK